jgi:mannose/fructose/N-acetylgalactosamine-specific phosphotransferase system component IID
MTSLRRLSLFDLTRLATWGLVLQASFHTGRRQAVGVAAAMASLSHLWPLAEDRRRFLLRHLEPMNTNPAMAGPLLGALARLEERAAAGEEGALERLLHLRRILEGPLAATGDALLWTGLRPAAALLGTLVAWFAGLAGPLVFLILYNGVHLGLRWGGVFWGHARGERIHELMRARWLRALRVTLRWGIPVFSLVLIALAASGGGLPRWTVAPAAAGGVMLGQKSLLRGGFLAGGAIMVGLMLALVFGSGTR